VYLHGVSIAVYGSGLVDRTQYACLCTIPASGLAWRTKYSCCFATSSARKQSSMARVGGSVSDSSSVDICFDDLLLHSERPLFDNRTERKERRQRLFSRYADAARQRCTKGGR
jgi:hypothetical protein